MVTEGGRQGAGVPSGVSERGEPESGAATPAPVATPATVMALTDVRLLRIDGRRRFTLWVPMFTLAQGERVALLGRSGSGKSSFIELIACARAPTKAALFKVRPAPGDTPVNVRDAWEKGEESRLTRLRATAFGYVQQSGGLLDFLTVRENIALTQTLAGRRDPQRLESLAERLGITALLDQRPRKLSGGERQRAVIARALAHRPAILVADEPTASLDSQNAEGVMTLLCELAAVEGIPLVLATHDADLVETFGFEAVRVREAADEESGDRGSVLERHISSVD